MATTLIAFSLPFWISLLFPFPRNSLVFVLFSLLCPRIFGVRQRFKKKKKPCFFGGFPCRFAKESREKRRDQDRLLIFGPEI